MSAAAAATANEAPPAPKKSKKLLFILIGVLVLGLLAAGGALYVMKKNAAAAEGLDEEEPIAHAKPLDAKSAPTFLPLDNMVVNLADAGGNRFIQVGLTLQLEDTKTADAVKAFMPSIRSRVLLLISQRTADEMLTMDGKEKLANDIMTAIGEIMGYVTQKAAVEDSGKKAAPKKAEASPVQAVHFSSLIVQ
ncbi:flagellar basal body-associated FliL family protein [Hydrogenophaga sp.]|uniref:flagellar basal body-associated FliL family protein n=1 Tax=Hydrogenophaga sp. TaxID=1904254 RepID=UPI0035B13500